jgi:hypothetical protein
MPEGQLIRKEQVGITWERMLDTEQLALYEELACQNYGVELIVLPITLMFQAAFEPLHLGTVWPHDNALIAAGFRHYGCHTEACRIFRGMVEAATHFAHRADSSVTVTVMRVEGQLEVIAEGGATPVQYGGHEARGGSPCLR